MTVLDVRNLRKHFPVRQGLLGRVTGQVKAVDDVSSSINAGETLSLVGESGCGKTTTSRCIPRAIKPSSGEILFRTGTGEKIDVAPLEKKQLRPTAAADADDLPGPVFVAEPAYDDFGDYRRAVAGERHDRYRDPQ